MGNSTSWKPTNSFFLLLCTVGLFAILSSTMSKNPVLSLFAKSLGTPDPWMGFVAAASTIPGILVSLPAGALSDVIGRRKMMIFSGVVFASAPFLYLFVTLPWQLILARFYHGFATAIFVPVANAAIVERFPKKKGERISVFSSATMVGRSVAPFLGGYILFVTGSNFHELYVWVGVAGVTAFLLALALYGEKTKQDEIARLEKRSGIKWYSGFFGSWKGVVRNRGVLVASVVELATYYSFGAFEYFLALYAKSAGLNDFFVGIVMGSQPVTIVISKPFMGRLSDRFGRRTPILAGLLLASVALIATPFVSHFIELIAVSVTYGLGFSLVTSSTPALVSDLVGEEMSGTAMGFLSTMMDVGQTSGPIITGLIFATAAGFSGSFISLGLILLVFSGFFFALTRTKT